VLSGAVVCDEQVLVGTWLICIPALPQLYSVGDGHDVAAQRTGSADDEVEWGRLRLPIFRRRSGHRSLRINFVPLLWPGTSSGHGG
jgi:hypothetical protein